MKILGAALGNCVHVAGVLRFLSLADTVGHETIFLGPATSIEEIIRQVKKHEPDVIGVSYRLTPNSAMNLLQELKEAIVTNHLDKKKWLLGCTSPIEPIAKKTGLFEAIFTGFSTDEDVLAYLKGRTHLKSEEKNPQDLMTRLAMKNPLPIIRHHFGLPTLEETLIGIEKIAEASVLDVISIGPDQNAQEFFFCQSKMNENLSGAGGVPIRTSDDLRKLFKSSRHGNFPLLRCYSGTRDLLKWAELLRSTINNAWCATPLTWYSELDGRSKRSLEEAIKENQENHRWHAKHNIPVEVNESHQWSLRCTHDTIAVAMAYLAAYNAKAAGVTNYIAQYMLNTPLSTSPQMDLAKMFAKIELIESLHDNRFTSVRQVRPGLFSFPPDLDMGKGQLAASIYTGMMLRPAIIHVVGFNEASHAATDKDIVESCKIARRVIHECRLGMPNPLHDRVILERKEELIREAKVLIGTLISLRSSSTGNPLIEPETYVRAVKIGVLDAPHLKNNPIAKGELKTKMIGGACLAIASDTGAPIDELTRLADLGLEIPPQVTN